MKTAFELADAHEECAKAWLESSDAHKFRKETAAMLRSQAQEIESLKQALRWQPASGLLEKIEALQKERDGYKADAERYRWLRGCNSDQLRVFGHYASDALDAAIDAAMKGQS